LEPSGFDLRGEQQVGHQPQQPVGVAFHGAQVGQLFGCQRVVLVVDDQFQVAQDGTERGPQLVRDQVHELVFHPGLFPVSGDVGADEQVAVRVAGGVAAGGDRDLDAQFGPVRGEVGPVPHPRGAVPDPGDHRGERRARCIRAGGDQFLGLVELGPPARGGGRGLRVMQSATIMLVGVRCDPGSAGAVVPRMR
jgi:hypothetical protein